MVVNQLRFGQVGRMARSLPRPGFGSAQPAIQNALKVGIQRDSFAPFKIHEPAGEHTARIILLPKSELPGFLGSSLEQASATLKDWSETRMMVLRSEPLTPLSGVEKALASLAASLAKAITPDTDMDENGNLFGAFKIHEPEYEPGATDEEKAATDAQTARQNKGAIVGAFKKQLEKVPAGITSVSIELPEVLPNGVKRDEVLRDLAELVHLNGYNYNQFRGGVPRNNVQRVLLSHNHPLTPFRTGDVQSMGDTQALLEGSAIGQATNLARHLVDSPANPERTRLISEAAETLRSPTLRVDVRSKAWLQAQKMNMMLSVGDGNAAGLSDCEPRMIEMEYRPEGWNPATGKTVLLVGKGIVFDTGGTNLKSSEYIHNMRGDMAGGAAVIGALKAIDQTRLKGVRVIGLVPLTENRIGNNASLENRAVIARNGKRVAISNTDAEGRLVLGDAIHYGMEGIAGFRPDVVVDIATLTGGKSRGLGAQNAVAISGNNRDLMKAADSIEKDDLGRKTAVLPLTQAHHRWVTRDAAKQGGESFADVYNSVGRDDAVHYGVLSSASPDSAYMLQHSAQGAAFLREFLANPQTPWVHYDMAGAEYDKKDPRRGNWEWATGFGVKDLYHLVKRMANGEVKPDPTKTAVVKPFSDEDLR